MIKLKRNSKKYKYLKLSNELEVKNQKIGAYDSLIEYLVTEKDAMQDNLYNAHSSRTVHERESRILNEAVLHLKKQIEKNQQTIMNLGDNISDKAYVIEGMVKDLKESDKTINAFNNLQELSRQELIEARNQVRGLSPSMRE